MKYIFDILKKIRNFVAKTNLNREQVEYRKTKAACNYFLDKAKEEGMTLTPMQAIKLVYFAHGYTLAILNHPLIDDHVEAWKFGAVIPSLYHSLKIYGAGVISAPVMDTEGMNYMDILCLSPSELFKKYPKSKIEYNFEEKENEVLAAVWEVYKGKSGFQLSAYIHQPDTPWTQVWESVGQYSKGAVISDDLIKSYYVAQISPKHE